MTVENAEIATAATFESAPDVAPVVGTINALLAEFKTLAEKQRPTPSQQREAATYLARAVQTALTNGSSNAFDALLDFVKANVKGVARGDVMLGGLNTLPPAVFTQVSTVYTVLTYLATKVGRAPDSRAVSKHLKGDTRFVVWSSLQK